MQCVQWYIHLLGQPNAPAANCGCPLTLSCCPHKKIYVAKLPCVRRQYTCTVCREPMTSPGHSQFYGKRYCPNATGQIPKEEWLAQRRAEKSEKSS